MAATWDDLQSLDEQKRKAALVCLWDANRSAMYNLGLRLLHNEATAADAVQEAICRFMQALRRGRPDCQPQTYLMRIVHHTCIDWLRKDRRVVPLATQELPARSDAGRPDKRMLLEERRQIVRQALSRLPEWAQAVIALRFIEGLANEQAADVLQIRKNTLEVRLHRALQLLGDALATRGPEPEDY